MHSSVSNPEDSITVLMNAGFKRAADSFSQMIHGSVLTAHIETVIQPDTDTILQAAKGNRDFCVLTTQLMGELSGKSYLVLSQDAYQSVCQSAFSGREVHAEIQDGLLLELDNIISASVISELVNALKVELYGDVPQLKRIPANALSSFLTEDYPMQDHTKLSIISSVTFTIGKKESVQFIWKLSPKILEMISENVKTIL